MSNFISHRYNLVIIHVPKCGGSSIRKHPKLKFSEKYFGYIPENYLSYRKIGFCRHPIDRFISAFKMFKFGTNNTSPKIQNLTIDDAINYLLDESVGYKIGISNIEDFKHHAIPITHPYNCIKYADAIIRFENYAKDVERYVLNHCCSTVGKKIPINIQKTNYTKADHHIVLDQTQKENLWNYYKQDFKTFKYEI